MSLLRSLASAVRHPGAAEVPSLLRSFVGQPLVFDLISAIAQWRDLGRLRRSRGRYLSDDPQLKLAHDHNVGLVVDKGFTRSRRVEPYYRILTAGLEDIGSKRLLVVGGRNVAEFLLAWTLGLRWKNMVGIDLFSANRKILVMNMEAMTFPDASFDLITCVNTLGYTDGVEAGIGECARVLRPGGRFVFDHSYRPEETRWPVLLLPGAEVLAICRKAGLEIYFHTMQDKITRRGGMRQTTHVIGCYKRPADQTLVDRSCTD